MKKTLLIMTINIQKIKVYLKYSEKMVQIIQYIFQGNTLLLYLTEVMNNYYQNFYIKKKILIENYFK